KATDKGKGLEANASDVKPATEKDKGRVVKKRAARVQRKNVISDSEETEEEEPVFKRKRTEPVQEEADPEKAQP
ncbi:hypothetical protein A2U01_0104104, partial [Trifolium medium]|nr:hypothetical protein [Trifolium medium]